MKIFKKNLIIVVLIVALVFGLTFLTKSATVVNLGTANSFGVLAGSTITNTGASVINGNLGLSPGTSVTGFPTPGTINGTQYVNDATSAQAQLDLVTAYDNAVGQTPASTVATELGSTIKTPGIYNSSAGTFGITGTLTLDAQGDPNAVFIFKMNTTLTTAGSSVVSLINGAQARNVFWQVGSSATLGIDSIFKGNILALTSVTLTTGANVEGRVLARNGAVTLDTNIITVPTTLHVIKTVTNNSGGTAVVSSFNLHVKLSGVDVAGSPAVGTASPGTSYSLLAGTYVVSEDAFAGYATTFSGDCNSSGSVTLLSGDDKTCTINNNDISPQLTVTKIVVNDSGGTKVIADFPLFIDGVSATSGASNTVLAGLHTVSETTDVGYTSAITGDCATNGTITLALGDVKSCTITNNDIAPRLTVTKVVVNDNSGTKVIADFPLFIDGVSVTSGASNTVLAGLHTVSETTDIGYTSTITGDCATNGTITLALGDVKSCTITNNDILPAPATLHIIKSVINNSGGTAIASSFNIHVKLSGTDVSGSPAVGAVSPGTSYSLVAGTYVVSEDANAGYTTTFGGDCNSVGSVVLTAGSDKTCTITNDDIAPVVLPATLHVIKSVTNNSGGTAIASSFNIHVKLSGTDVSGSPAVGAVSPGTSYSLVAGTYVVSEDANAGYTTTFGGDCNSVGSVVLTAGSDKTCTITNDDIAPVVLPATLHIIKSVTNNSGGTAIASAFNLHVKLAGVDVSGSPAVGVVSPGTSYSLVAGTYVVSEDANVGYTTTFSGDCNSVGSVVLTAGSDKTCTITNDDIAPPPPLPATLHIIKSVINDSGGTATPPLFNLHVKLAGVDVSGSPTMGTASPGTSYTLVAGTYVVSEDVFAGYTSTFSGDCDSSGNITLLAGEDKTCTIINDDDVVPVVIPDTATINVVKIVINDNGRNKVITDFPLFVNSVSVISGATNSFLVPATYTVTETTDINYTKTFSGDCDINGSTSLVLGDNKFCIVTNNDIAPPAIASSGGSGSGSYFAPVVVPPVPPLIEVIKVPNPLALPNGAGPVEYTYTLKNIGTVPVTDITMVGDTCSPINLISGDTNSNAKLEVTETWVYRCSTTLAETHTNTIVATGWANGLSATDIASATVVVGTPIVPPLIHVTKVPKPLTLLAGGGMVTYTEKVTNPGKVALNNITLTDDKCSPMKYISGDTNGDTRLDVTETWTYTCQTKLTKTTTNTAVATGEANGLKVRDFAIVTVVVTDIIPILPNTGMFFGSILNAGVVLLGGILGLALLIIVVKKFIN